MNKLYFWLFICWLTSPVVLLAQSPSSITPETRWQQAQALFEQGAYAQTLETLRPLTAISANNTFAPQANYLYSLTLYKQHELKQAQGAVENLLQKFPQWPQITEAYYLAGVIAAERQQWSKALQFWQFAYTDELKTDLNNAKLRLLAPSPTDTLRFLQEKYAADATLAFMLANRLSSSSRDADKLLLDKLQHGFNFSEFKTTVAQENTNNQTFNIAALLPFAHQNTNYKAANRSNQPILDFYIGIKMAIDELASSRNININLMAYDTEKNASKIQSLLALPEVSKADMILGPIYPQGAAEIAAFAQEKQIMLLNPLTSQRQWDSTNQWAYMSEATAETQTKRVAEFSAKNLKGNKVAIIYGVTSKDTMMANLYKKLMEAEGRNIALYRQVGKNSAANLVKFLFQAGIDSTTSHIFVPNDEPLVKIQLMGAMGLLHLKVPIITYDTWLQSTDFTFEEWQRRNTHFIYPTYIDDDNEEVKRFKKKYIEKIKIMPSIRAFQGYDLMMYFGGLFADYGKDFRSKLRTESYRKGILLSGFDYRGGTDNQFVPIFKIEDLNLKLVNQPE
ncbi:ABC-type branched-chain amino acid transport system, substrate-binding protein [Flexibacter flexilis DSM 6793]|uniref:ABC-type branched-chain amino acid transport system, substrate-binding protein n=1 Tax=Flexibacter flexilis DSM 6793 TaxID=927664 RepID=A0A1I1M3U2_9BACT|nr:ABC transporter substrate-binding protein [Flexibacter flexilis]SFC80157.1 ABC-type branched-chain amino acid transport system, substrate-binding protein [Flexibacter flexilis DSM 6793]